MSDERDDGIEMEIEIDVDSSAGLFDDPASMRATPDPSMIAASLMIEAALDADNAMASAVLTPGALVLVEVPAVWLAAVVESWSTAVEQYISRKAAPRTARSPSRAKKGREHHQSALLVRAECKPGTFSLNGESRRALRAGRSVVVLTGSADDLPLALTAAADVNGAIRPLDASCLIRLAESLGEGKAELPAADIDGIAPDDLVYACRAGQSAGDFARRVLHILSRRRAKSLASGPSWTVDIFPLPAPLEAWARQLVRDMDDYRAGRLPWADVDRGALLYGPTGCGKTTAVAAIAASLRVPLIVGGYSVWEGGENGQDRYHDIIRNIRLCFAKARQTSCVLLIDELDAFIARGDAGHNESWFAPLMSALLTELDGATRRDGIVVIGTTNFPDRIDPALRRAGRLDRAFEMPMPDRTDLKRILEAQLDGDLAGADLEPAARAALGGSGADCEKWCRGARRRARVAGREILMSDLLAEIRDRGEAASPNDRRRIATREAGHAVTVWVRRPGSVHEVTIVPGLRTRQREYISVLSMLDTYTRAGMQGFIIELLAGRAAEDVILDEVATGSVADLATATELAVLLDVSLGLYGTLLSYGVPKIVDIRAALERPDVRQRAEETLHRAYEEALALVRTHRSAVVAIADALLARESLTGAELEGFITMGRQPAGARH